MHDFRVLKKNLSKFGWLTKIMLRNDLPEWARPNIVVDKGYVGIDKLLPGARIMIPVNLGMGSDEGGELSQDDRDHNREVAQVRYMVEVAVGRIKQYGVMSGPYRGTPEQYDKDTNILTGLGQPQDIVVARQGGPRRHDTKSGRVARARLTYGWPRVAPFPSQIYGIGGCGEAAHVMPHISQIDPPRGPKNTVNVRTRAFAGPSGFVPRRLGGQNKPTFSDQYT